VVATSSIRFALATARVSRSEAGRTLRLEDECAPLSAVVVTRRKCALDCAYTEPAFPTIKKTTNNPIRAKFCMAIVSRLKIGFDGAIQLRRPGMIRVPDFIGGAGGNARTRSYFANHCRGKEH
jgi:hypothetical protein